LIFLGFILYSEARAPKFFFVSSTTSTSVSTTTSMISATITCLQLSSTTYAACSSGRKKRAKIINDEGLDLDMSIIGSKSSSHAVQQIEDSIEDRSSKLDRQARFAWYYMTTTLTSISTSTSTSTSTAVTVSVSALACTPSTYIGCGKK